MNKLKELFYRRSIFTSRVPAFTYDFVNNKRPRIKHSATGTFYRSNNVFLFSIAISHCLDFPRARHFDGNDMSADGCAVRFLWSYLCAGSARHVLIR